MIRGQFIIRLPRNVIDRLDEVAEEKGVTRNALVTTILIEWVREQGSPRFKHFNCYNDHVTIFDEFLNKLVDVYVREGKIMCDHDRSEDCPHVRFAYTLEPITRLVKKGDLKLKK